MDSDTDSDSSQQFNSSFESDSTGNDETPNELQEVHRDSLNDDELVKAIEAEKNKARDHPPTIKCDDFIVDISMHPAENIIAIANILGDVCLYEYNNEETKCLNTLELHLKACRDIEFSKNGSTLFSTAKDKVIIACDVETGKFKNCYEDCHDEPVYRLKCLDSDRIVTGDDGGTVKLWDMRQPTAVFSIKIGEDYIGDMITNDTQKYLVCAGGDGVLTTIDLKGRKVYTTSEEYECEFTCMGLFRSNTKLLVGSSIGKFYLFNWKEFGLHSDEFMGQRHSIHCMIPITQNIVVTSGEDGVLRAAHMFPHQQLGIVGQHALPVDCLDISHDGNFITSCSHDHDVKFWNISYFETIDSIIDVYSKKSKKKIMGNNLPSSTIKNASDFFSALV